MLLKDFIIKNYKFLFNYKKVNLYFNILECRFYYLYYYDFRGRFYTDSVVGYTNNPFVRYLLHFGLYSDSEIHNYTVSEEYMWFKHNHLFFKNKNYENNVHYYFELNILFELGKIIKSKAPDYDGKLTYLDFINLGEKLFLDVDNTYNLEEIDLFNKQILCYRLQKSNQLYKYKYLFYKDATASGLQILGLILKPKTTKV